MVLNSLRYLARHRDVIGADSWVWLLVVEVDYKGSNLMDRVVEDAVRDAYLIVVPHDD